MEPQPKHKWSPEDNMFDRCIPCGLVQGVLAPDHFTSQCPAPRK